MKSTYSTASLVVGSRLTAHPSDHCDRGGPQLVTVYEGDHPIPLLSLHVNDADAALRLAGALIVAAARKDERPAYRVGDEVVA